MPSSTPVVDATPELLYLLAGDPAELAEMLSTMRPADIADALNQLEPDGAATVISVLPFDLAVRVLDEPQLDRRHLIFSHCEDHAAGPLIEAMSADQQAELFRDLPEGERSRLIKTLDAPTRESLKLLLQYPPATAGGIMTTEFVSMPSNWTVEEAMRHIRDVGRAKETVYAIYVLDPADQRLVHMVSLRELMLSDRSLPVGQVGDVRKPVSVPPLMAREDVARLLSKYNLLAVPVVDDQQHVIGIVTVDDVIDAIVKEQTEDVQKFGGMEALGEPYMQISLMQLIRKRAPWLCVLFLSEMLTATAMQHFSDELSRAVVLAMFIPLVMSSGGNSGSQATSLIIRAMALREVTLRDWWRVAVRELPTGIVLGTMLGVLGILRISIWQAVGFYDYGVHHVLIAITIGCALVGVVTFGSLTGSMLPFVLRRLGFDPASASAPFVATLVDVTGLIIYFTVAFAILKGTLL
ncbi:MAG: magnesium transporter [Gemmatimonadota bacterium]|nr:magnesium transporter [Gemmatimonadota bacterium]